MLGLGLGISHYRYFSGNGLPGGYVRLRGRVGGRALVALRGRTRDGGSVDLTAKVA